MKSDPSEYSRLVDENRLLREKTQELNLEIAWMKGMLFRFGVPVTGGKRTVLTITKGGKAV